MPGWPELITAAIINGALLSLTLVLIMVISGAIALDMWVGDYPPDIRDKYGPMSAKARRARPFFGAAFFLAVVAIPLFGLAALRNDFGPFGFLPAFVFGGAAVFIFNLFDLLVLDWVLFCTVQPRMMVLPGTEGMAGYRDYRFHFIGFLKGLGFCLFGGLVIGGLWTGVQALLL